MLTKQYQKGDRIRQLNSLPVYSLTERFEPKIFVLPSPKSKTLIEHVKTNEIDNKQLRENINQIE